MLELLIVLAVIAGLWTVAYPNVQTARERAQSLPATTLDVEPAVLGLVEERPGEPVPVDVDERCFLVRVGATGSTTEPVPCADPAAPP